MLTGTEMLAVYFSEIACSSYMSQIFLKGIKKQFWFHDHVKCIFFSSFILLIKLLSCITIGIGSAEKGYSFFKSVVIN